MSEEVKKKSGTFDENWFVIQSLVDLRNAQKDFMALLMDHQKREEEKFDGLNDKLSLVGERLVSLEERVAGNSGKFKSIGSVVVAAVTALITSFVYTFTGRAGG